MIWLSVQIILILYSSHFSGLWIQLPTLALGLHFGNICSCIIFASSKVYSDFGPKHIQIDLSGLIWFGWLHMRINMDIWIDWFVWLIDDSAWIQIRFRILDSVHIRMILFFINFLDIWEKLCILLEWKTILWVLDNCVLHFSCQNWSKLPWDVLSRWKLGMYEINR